MRTLVKMCVALIVGATSAAAMAAPVVLNFAGVASPSNQTAVGGFYDGGTSGDGNSGPNYGVAFSDNALAINSYNGCCEPDSPTPGILFFLSGGAVTVDVAAGFTTGFSFFYSSNSNAFINVYDGAHATGNILATLSLVTQANSACPPGATGFYCTWTPIGVTFAGTAKSIDFGGGANFVAYDDITFGSSTPGSGTPEPAAWALMIVGFGLVGTTLRRRNAVVAA